MDHLPGAKWISTAPGRVNLLGEHVDYNDGPVLPVAIDRAVRMAFEPRQDRLVQVQALDLGREYTFNLDQLDAHLDPAGKKLPNWVQYPAGVAWALQKHGYSPSGMRAVYTSDVPIGAGLSSSAAVEVAFATAWQALEGWTLDKMTLARICQRAENEYIGVNSGLMDQFASTHGVEGHALYFDTRTLAWQPVPLPAGTSIIIADTGVRRSLAASAYNERRAACEKAVELLRQHLPGIQALRDVSPHEFQRYASELPDIIRMRAQHVVEECDRVEQALRALQRGDGSAFGQLMFAGHISLRDLYEVSTPELDILVNEASQLPGCLGARLTGAGFGGCTVNLVEDKSVTEFIEAIKDRYKSATVRETQVTLCHASQGAWVDPL